MEEQNKVSRMENADLDSGIPERLPRVRRGNELVAAPDEHLGLVVEVFVGVGLQFIGAHYHHTPDSTSSRDSLSRYAGLETMG